MSHFAKVQRIGIGSTSLGVVKEVIVADQTFIDHMTTNFPEDNVYWVQTSYNTSGGVHILGGTPLRKNFASPGSLYDPVRDAFYSAKPYPSFVLDESTCLWETPVGIPTTSIAANEYYLWDEFTKAWIVKTRGNEWFSVVGLSTGA
mgnify:FL=1